MAIVGGFTFFIHFSKTELPNIKIDIIRLAAAVQEFTYIMRVKLFFEKAGCLLNLLNYLHMLLKSVF